MDNFENKVVVISGVSSGIGKCIAQRFIETGAKVIGIDKDNCSLNCDYFYLGDLTEKTVVENFASEIIKRYGKVDYIVNNAGLTKGGLLSCDWDNFLYVQKLSLAAPFLLVKLLMNSFNEDASVINISSTRAFQSQSDWESYAAAKGGIVALTHSMSVTLKGKARVNCISPGWIDTLNSELSKEDKNQHSVERVGTPNDITNAVMFLCSDKSGFITGQNITIDGGISKLMVYHNDYGWSFEGD